MARASASLLSRRIMGTKHSAAKTPRTAPMTPALGGPGMPYTYLNATESEPYAAATKMSKPRPYHTDRFAGSAEPSMPSSAPSPSNARVVTLRRAARMPRARPDARARAGRGAERTSPSRRRSRRTRRRWETALGALARSRGRDDRAAGRDAGGAFERRCALGRSTRARARGRTEDGARRTSKGTRSENLRERRDHTRRRGRRRGAPGAGARVRGARRVCRASGRTRRGVCVGSEESTNSTLASGESNEPRWVFAVAKQVQTFPAIQCG